MTTFNWQITSMPAYSQIDGQTEVVFQVNWRCEGTEDRLSAVTVGSVPVTYTANTEFTSYADLTQEQVWDWINPQIDRPSIESNLQSLIDEQKNPKTVTLPLSWSN